MNFLIIEDEKPAYQKLKRLLRDVRPGSTVLDVLESVEQSVNWFLKNPEPDLIFMDIQLEDGLCFEIFEQCTIRTPVIFTTAYDAYTLRAFKVNSIDYLLKPIDPEELKNAITRYDDQHRHTDLAQFEAVLKQLQPETKERFLIKIGDHFKPVRASAVRCFYILERCSFLRTDSGNNYPLDYSLDTIEKLVDPKMFFRVNRHFIVNISAIRDIYAWSSSRLKIILDGWDEKEEIIVSRDRVPDFKKWMDYP
jgi:DNA-binding LytR/AlgR family response regulator